MWVTILVIMAIKLFFLLALFHYSTVPSEATHHPNGHHSNSSEIKILQARPYLTEANSQFGENIEGLTVTPGGNIYAVNFGTKDTTNQLGQVYPTQRLLYRDIIATAKFNGMFFTNETSAYAVDQNNARILRLELDDQGQVLKSDVYCSDSSMVPPNDVVVSFQSGSLFISGMNWKQTTSNTDGEIWVCGKDRIARRIEQMGRVNGIELSPDEKTLYATEGYTSNWVHVGQRIWKYDVNVEEGTISNKRVFVDFANVTGDSVTIDLDGLKTDKEGNLLAVRFGGSNVAIFSKEGDLISRVQLNFLNPTNLELDHAGKLFICGRDPPSGKGFVDEIEWDPLKGY